MKWKIYEYHWMDHYRDKSWGLLDKHDMPKPVIITSVGIKVGEDKDYIYFTEGIQSDGDNFNGVMSVMRKNIVYKKHIRTVNTKQYKT